jgi:hypothetical protein
MFSEAESERQAERSKEQMTTLASKLLSERRFWNVISRSLGGTDSVGLTATRQEQLLEQELERLSRDEFTGFLGHYYHNQHHAYRNDLWAVAYVVMGGCSNDCFIDFRKWLVMRGKSVYRAALQDPDSLCVEFDKIPKGDIPLWEYYPSRQYDRRFGGGAHDRAYQRFKFPPVELFDPENEWNSDDEASIRKLCPRVFQKYWGNSRF